MSPIRHQHTYCRIYNAIYCRRKSEQYCTNNINNCIYRQWHFANTKSFKPFGKNHTNNIQTTTWSTGLQCYPNSCSSKNSTNYACSKGIPYNWYRRYRNQTKKQCLTHHTNQCPKEKFLTDKYIGKYKQWNIQKHVNNTRNIRCPGCQMKITHQYRTNHLTNSQNTTIIKICRYDKKINTRWKNQHTDHCNHISLPKFPLCIHIIASFLKMYVLRRIFFSYFNKFFLFLLVMNL